MFIGVKHFFFLGNFPLNIHWESTVQKYLDISEKIGYITP